MVGPGAGLGEGVEVGVTTDHLLDPLARGVGQLLERDLADDPVPEVAPGQSWPREQGDQDGGEQAKKAGVNHSVTINAQVAIVDRTRNRTDRNVDRAPTAPPGRRGPGAAPPPA